jgi:glycosyltransferase involved in cell wall biosynthesis
VKANYLAEVLGYDVTIVTTEQHDRPPYFKTSPKVRMVDLQINYTDHPQSRGICLLDNMRKSRLHRQSLENLLLEIRPDITISVYRHELPFLYKLKDGSKKIFEQHFCRGFRRICEHPSRIDLLKEALLEKFEEFYISKLSYLVILTEEEKSLYWNRLSNAIVIPNPITIEANKDISLHSKRIIAVGRYSYIKG